MTDKLSGFKESFFTDPKKRAIAALAIGVLTFAFVPILIRLGESEISATAVMFHRFWIAAIILGLWKGLQIARKGFNTDGNGLQGLNRQTLALFLGSGICFAVAQQVWALSLTQTSVANSALLHNFTPLFATLGGWLFFTQRFDRRFLTGAFFAIIGSIVLGFDDFIYETDKIQGDIISLGSALFFAIYFLLVEQIRNQFVVTTILLYCCAIATVTVFPFLLISEEPFLPSSSSGWLTLLGLAFTLLLFYGLTTYALKWLSSGLVTVILLLEPILSAILAWSIFAEALDFWNVLAFPIVLFGIYLATTSKSVSKDETDEIDLELISNPDN